MGGLRIGLWRNCCEPQAERRDFHEAQDWGRVKNLWCIRSGCGSATAFSENQDLTQRWPLWAISDDGLRAIIALCTEPSSMAAEGGRDAIGWPTMG
jgi:hypothetical protein